MNPDQFAKVLDQFAAGLPKAIAEAERASVFQFKNDFIQRVFNVNATKDLKGGIRKYSKRWEEIRRDVYNYTNSNVNLQLENTLRDSINVGEVNKVDVLKIEKVTSPVLSYTKSNGKWQKGKPIGRTDTIEKARNEEKRRGEPIFEANEREEKRVQKAFEVQLGKYFKKFFD